MRLDLPIPATWPRVAHAVFGEIAFVPGSSGPSDLAITRSALNLLPDEQPEWIEQTLHADTMANTHVTITSNDVRATRTGWPVRIVTSTLHRGASDAATSEWRTVAFYAFFEHGATAVIRSTNEARYREHHEALLDLLLAGSPDWSGEVACLFELWDVASDPTHRQPVREQLVRSAVSPTGRLEELAEQPVSFEREIERGEILRSLGESERALEAFRAALSRDVSSPVAHRGIAAVLALTGHEREAIAAWREVAARDPMNVDAWFDIGIAYYNLTDYGLALEAWHQALSRSPRDFWILRKIIQALFALERYEDVQPVRAQLLEIWSSSRDLAVTMQADFVFDQFRIPGTETTVQALETLRPQNPFAYPILTFRVVDPKHRFEVLVETSDVARSAGEPYVLCAQSGARHSVLGASAQLPPYFLLKQRAIAQFSKMLSL